MATLEHNLETFQKIASLVASAGHTIILSGSTSLVLQGVKDLKVHDIDIVTDEKGAKFLDEILRDDQSAPLKYSGTDKYRSWHGRYTLDGCDIDVIGDFQYRLKDGGWSTPNHLHEIHQFNFRGMNIPVLSLEQELQEYENVDRDLKAAKIRKALQK